MSSMFSQESLLQKLVTFVKYLKLLKLSFPCVPRHVLILLRRLLYGISNKLSSLLPRPKLSADIIMGATQSAAGDTHNQPPANTSTTLAVRPLENLGGNASSFQNFGISLAFPLAQVPINLQPYSVQGSSSIPNVHGPPILPMVASQIDRYERNIVQSNNFHVFEVSPGPDNFTEPSMQDPNWLQLTHPEGARFFFNPLQKVFTDQNIWENGLASDILAAAEHARQRAASNGSAYVEMELAIEKLPEGGFGYYFVDHEEQIIRWPEPVRSRELMNHVRGVTHKSHIKYALEAQYWCVTNVWFDLPALICHRKHCTLFPNMRVLPGPVVNRLRDIIAYAHAESITSKTSLSPFDLGELSNMLSVVDHVKESVETENEHSVCIVARYMDMFIRAKFVNFCGQLGARLDADRSLYDGYNRKKPKPIILRILNVVLFNSPKIHSDSLHDVWVDNTVVNPRWKKFITQLNSEWNSFTVFSTVMLAVDVSFLAVPGVTDPSIQSKSAVTIVIYLSTLCAMGSLVISLMLAGQVNDSRRSSAGNVASFMISMSKSLLGIESVALMHSLPFALLIWGMIFFAIGLSILIFYTTDIAALSVIAPIWAVVVLLTTWPVLAANDLHVSVFARQAVQSWKAMVIIRRQ